MTEEIIDVYLAKYPFLPEAKQVLSDREWGIEEMLQESVRERAKERVISAIHKDSIGERHSDREIEILSYPLARLIVSAIDEFQVTKKYVSSESANAKRNIREDIPRDIDDPFDTEDDEVSFSMKTKEHIDMGDICSAYGIDIRVADAEEVFSKSAVGDVWEDMQPDERARFVESVFSPAEGVLGADSVADMSWSDLYTQLDRYSDFAFSNSRYFKVPVKDYLDMIERGVQGWRLSMLPVSGGEVIVEYSMLLDLIEMRIRRDIGSNLPMDVPTEVAEQIESDVGKVMVTIPEDMFYDEVEEVREGAFPPVIQTLLEQVRDNENLIHEERFTLASFLISIGMTNDEIIDLLELNSEFGEEATRYQLNHIREKGEGGDSYTPPTYEKIRTWGVEWEADALEAEVSHPLVYYRIKLSQGENDPSGEE